MSEIQTAVQTIAALKKTSETKELAPDELFDSFIELARQIEARAEAARREVGTFANMTARYFG